MVSPSSLEGSMWATAEEMEGRTQQPSFSTSHLHFRQCHLDKTETCLPFLLHKSLITPHQITHLFQRFPSAPLSWSARLCSVALTSSSPVLKKNNNTWNNCINFNKNVTRFIVASLPNHRRCQQETSWTRVSNTNILSMSIPPALQTLLQNKLCTHWSLSYTGYI